MITMQLTREQQSQVIAFVDGMRANLVKAMEDGVPVFLHTAATTREIEGFPDYPRGMIVDVMQTGWTFGVTIGELPRLCPDKSPNSPFLFRIAQFHFVRPSSPWTARRLSFLQFQSQR